MDDEEYDGDAAYADDGPQLDEVRRGAAGGAAAQLCVRMPAAACGGGHCTFMGLRVASCGV